MAKTTIRGVQIADGANGVDLNIDVSGVLPVVNGGTAGATAAAAMNNIGSGRTISTTAPLGGGGDLSANRTLTISPATTGAAGSMSSSDKSKLDNVTSGTWTPTLTNVLNAGSLSAQTCHYIRVGNEVSFSGTVSCTPTVTATNTQISITLPIASTLGSTVDDAAGAASTQQAIGGGGGFIRSDGAGKLLLAFTSAGTTAVTFRFSGHYIIN